MWRSTKRASFEKKPGDATKTGASLAASAVDRQPALEEKLLAADPEWENRLTTRLASPATVTF